MKKLRGYIFSRPFYGERVPQNIQNLVIRNYCEKNSFIYLLSIVEYCIEETFLNENPESVPKGLNSDSKYTIRVVRPRNG